jgi:hypothetical protein
VELSAVAELIAARLLPDRRGNQHEAFVLEDMSSKGKCGKPSPCLLLSYG